MASLENASSTRTSNFWKSPRRLRLRARVAHRQNHLDPGGRIAQVSEVGMLARRCWRGQFVDVRVDFVEAENVRRIGPAPQACPLPFRRVPRAWDVAGQLRITMLAPLIGP